MAVLESRPYRTALPGSVDIDVRILEPQCDAADLCRVWNPGGPIRIAVEARIAPTFWRETETSPWDGIVLVVRAVCLPARAAWRATAPVGSADPGEAVTAVVDIDGEIAAGELELEVWLAGPGRTIAQSVTDAIHPGAKLWQTSSPMRIGLDDDRSAFPTTILSFSSTGRPSAPWTVEVSAIAEPGWTVDASVLLLLNSDSPSAAAIADGTADEHIYALIRADIRMATILGLASCAEGSDSSELDALAAEVPESFAALGVQSAGAMSLSTGEALRMAVDDPVRLMAFARESTRFYREETAS